MGSSLAFRATDDPDGVAHVLNSLGEVARDAGQAEAALGFFGQALDAHWQTGNKRGMAGDLEGIAAACAMSGQGHAALVYFAAACAMSGQGHAALVYFAASVTLRKMSGGPTPG